MGLRARSVRIRREASGSCTHLAALLQGRSAKPRAIPDRLGGPEPVTRGTRDPLREFPDRHPETHDDEAGTDSQDQHGRLVAQMGCARELGGSDPS